MKTVRLIPVVIAATLALLVFKGIGIVTNGGYVLTGTNAVQAEGAAHAEGGGGDPTISLPQDVTMTDTSPTLADGAVTLPLHADAPAPAHGGEPAAAEPAVADAAAATPATACPDVPGAIVQAGDVAEAPKGAAAHSGEMPGFNFASEPDCRLDPGVNAQGDALALIKDGAGNLVPLAQVDPQAGSETALLERLGERRTELDARAAEIDMRLALVEAAEKRIDERAAALDALQKQISGLVDDKKAAQDAQFITLVAMYEGMKPKEAALIFDQLDIGVLMRVAGAVSPRKMGPILARMDPAKAKELTTRLAVDPGDPSTDPSRENLNALPQIVGQ